MEDRWRDNEGLLDAKRVILAELQVNGPLSHKYKIKHALLRERETEHDKTFHLSSARKPQSV